MPRPSLLSAALVAALTMIPCSLGGQPPDPDAADPEAADRTEEPSARDADLSAHPEEPAAAFGGSVEVLGEQPERADTVTVLGAEQIEGRRAPVAFDALDKEPGLHLRSRLGMSGAGLTRLVVRGLGGSGPAGLGVFVDGRPDSSVSFAHPTPSAHALAGVARLEVTHGPSPVLDGPGLTGVVRVVSLPPEQGTTGSLLAAAGSHDSTESQLFLSHGGSGAYAQVRGSYRATDGHNPDSDARVRSGHVKVGFDLGRRWDLALAAGRNEDHFSVFGPFFVPGPFANPGTEDLDLTQTVADLTLSGTFARWSGSIKLWHDDLEPESQALRPGARRAEVSESGARLRAIHSPASQRRRLIVGVDVLEARARNTPGLPPGRPEQDESLTEVGPYAFLEQRLGERATVLGGLRVVDHSRSGTEPVGELGMTWKLGAASADASHRTRLRARVTRGYQSPTLQELFGVFLGGRRGPSNPDLGPEIVDQLELGLNRSAGAWSLDVVAFVQEGKDLIRIVRGAQQNAGSFSHPGLEARLFHRPRAGVEWGLGATVIDLEDDVLGVPEQTLDLALEIAPPSWQSRDATVTLLARWSDGYRDQAAPAAPVTTLDEYFVADLKLRALLVRRLHGYLEIENLTDEDYQVVAGIPMPGLVALAGVRLDF